MLDVILVLLDIFIDIFIGNWERAWNGVILLTSVVMEMRNLYIMYEATHKVYYLQQLKIKVASFATLSIASKLLGKKINKLRDAVMDAINEAGLGGKCFVAGTLVSTPTGLVPIEDIKAGDVVLSFNEKTLQVSEQVVEETFVRESKELVKIKFGDEIITTTPEHRFYMPKKGFVDAIDLRAGDSLWTVNGECVIIEEVQHEMLESSVKVYNFCVARNHTYFESYTAIGVHNEYENQYEPSGRYSGELKKVPKEDLAADALAKRINGESRVRFENDPAGREFDAVSDDYIAQAKPALKTIGKSWRVQTKATFEAAKATARKAYFYFEGQPEDVFITKINEYAARYGVEVVIDTEPLDIVD